VSASVLAAASTVWPFTITYFTPTTDMVAGSWRGDSLWIENRHVGKH
jgi:hypothetical protein